MNNRDKMQRSNGKVRKLLTSSGFKDIYFFPHGKFQKDIFFLGVGFDGCASFGKKFVLFQTKSNSKCTKKMQKKLKELTKESGVLLLWFDCPDRKAPKCYGGNFD